MTNTRTILLAILAASLVVLLVKLNTARVVTLPERPSFPEFTDLQTENWLNAKPLPLAGLNGKVVLLFIWSFD
jgi:hypothetical protein